MLEKLIKAEWKGKRQPGRKGEVEEKEREEDRRKGRRRGKREERKGKEEKGRGKKEKIEKVLTCILTAIRETCKKKRER